MEIIKALLSFILGDKAETLSPILDGLKENSFDLVKFLSSLDLEKVAPIVNEFFGKNNSATPDISDSFSTSDKLSAIEKIADEKIVATLNEYFESGVNNR